MPVANRSDARDQILAVVATTAAAITPTPLPVIYDDTRQDKPRDGVAWARATLKHGSGNTATLAGAHGRTRKRRLGLLTIQVFTPSGDGLVTSDSIGQIFLDAFEGNGALQGVIFRDGTVNEADHSGPWQQANVVINFEYDQLVTMI